MGDAPPGYEGGSILPGPSTPIPMMKMSGGGGAAVGGGADLLEQPAQRIELQKFVGGAPLASASPAPPTGPNAPTGPKGQTIPISVGGLRVRYVDDSIKNDIQTLRFTPEENLLFTKYLNLGHPFVKKHLTSDAVKERFYEFWRLYVNYDGANNYHLMTYAEGKKCQDFLKGVLDTYREYLTNSALKFLKTSENPEKLIEPEPASFDLLETIEYTVNKPPVTVTESSVTAATPTSTDATPTSTDAPTVTDATPTSAAAPPVTAAEDSAATKASRAAKASTDAPSVTDAQTVAAAPTVAAAQTVTAAKDSTDATPPSTDAPPAAPSATEQPLAAASKETLKKELQEFIKTTFNDTTNNSEVKIIKVIDYLDTKIKSQNDYISMYKNATDIGNVSFSGKKVSQVEIIKQSESKTNDSITNFLRWLIKTDVTGFKRKNKEKFYNFFQKVVSPSALKDLANLKAGVLAPKVRVTRSNTKKQANATSERSQGQTLVTGRSK